MALTRQFRRMLFPVTLIALLLVAFPGTGEARTECKTEGCKITITIKIAYSGATDQQISGWTQDIEGVWNGPVGFQTTGDCKCEVRFKVETMKITDPSQVNCNPGPSGYHCVMVTPFSSNPPKDTNGTTYMGYMYPPGVSQGGQSLTGWWSDQMNRPAPGGGNYHDAAHEAGHMMGLDDKEGNGLMTHTSGDNAKPTQENIDDAVSNVCGPNACPDSCCCGNGVIDSGKGESCDPFAQPNGCKSGEACCIVCCSCFAPQCVPASGEYASQSECLNACWAGTGCYLNYKTGCWDCIKLKTVVEDVKYDPEHAREQGQAFHQVHSEEQAGAVKVTGGMPVTQEQLEMVRDMYNQNIGSVPQVRDLLANERINFYIKDLGAVAIVNKDGEMQSMEPGELSDQSMNMYTDMKTLSDIMSGELEPLDAIKQRKIWYEGVGFFNWLRFTFAKFFFDVGVALGFV